MHSSRGESGSKLRRLKGGRATDDETTHAILCQGNGSKIDVTLTRGKLLISGSLVNNRKQSTLAINSGPTEKPVKRYVRITSDEKCARVFVTIILGFLRL